MIWSLKFRRIWESANHFEKYFEADDFTNTWRRNPLDSTDESIATLPAILKESILELKCDKTLRTVYEKKGITDFWLHVRNDLFLKAMEILILFASTYYVKVDYVKVDFLL